jgi:hypothetical protein
MKSRRLSRRSLLEGIGASLAFLPLLSFERIAKAAPGDPKRLVILQATNGVLNDFWPSGSDTSFTLSPTMAPLEPFKSELLVLRGLDLKCQMESTVEGAGVGHQSFPFLLTGTRGEQGANSAGPCAVAASISIDQYIARALAPMPIGSLVLGAVEHSNFDNELTISYNGPALGNTPKRPDANIGEIDPYRVFEWLFGGGAIGAGDTSIDRLRRERRSVLDVVGRDLEAMATHLGDGDREKVERHLTSIRELELELQGSSTVSCAQPSPVPGGLPISDKSSLDRILRAQLDLVVQAFACDATRVATLMMLGPANDFVTFPFLGGEFATDVEYLKGDHHGISHGAGGGDGPEGPMKRKIDQWYMQLLADFLQKLKDNGLYDSTLVVWLNNMGNGASHGVDNIPFILAGSGQGYLRMGRYLSYDHAPHNGLFVAIANAMGVPTMTFGDPAYGGELSGLR